MPKLSYNALEEIVSNTEGWRIPSSTSTSNHISVHNAEKGITIYCWKENAKVLIGATSSWMDSEGFQKLSSLVNNILEEAYV